MGSTNKTTNYELSQYIGTDKPSWLNDYNNDMLKIDTQMKANATAAGNAQTTANTADGKADTNTQAISTLNTQINTPSTGLAATVADHTTAITGINSTIGSTPLTTVAQTLTGAIEEVKGSIPSVTSCLKFISIKTFTSAADGVKTYSQLLDDLHAQLVTYLASKTNSYRFQIISCNPNTSIFSSEFVIDQALMHDKTFTSPFSAMRLSLSLSWIEGCTVTGSNSTFGSVAITDGTYTDNSSAVPTTGNASLVIQEYEIA